MSWLPLPVADQSG